MLLKGKGLTIMVLLCVFLAMAGTALAQPTDTKGHWAQGQLEDWAARGLAQGYPDGSFKPDNMVTRAEFVALANRAFGFDAGAQAKFSDVSSGQWFAAPVSAAQAVGYITGYPDGSFVPGGEISRQEVAAGMARLLLLDTKAGSKVSFTDASAIPGWSKGAIGAVTAKGLMKGYPGGDYQPSRPITRAEVVVTLDRALALVKTTAYDTAGTYGATSGVETLEGNVIISAPGVTLQNTVINGSLLLAKGIGDGDVTLNNVTVKGDTIIKGGGANSVTLRDCVLGNITVDNEGVRVVATGTTTVKVVRLESGATLVEVTTTGAGFETVTVTQEIPAGASVTLEGNFTSVSVEAPGVELGITGGTVDSLVVAESAVGATVDLTESATVTTLTLNAQSSVTGEGTIETANINANDTTIDQTPATVNKAEGVDAKVGVTPGPTPTKDGGGGGGGISLTVGSINILGPSDSIIASGTFSGSSCTVDLAGKSPNTMITGIAVIGANEGSSLLLTGVNASSGYSATLNKTLSPSMKITPADLLGFPVPGDDISLSSLRGFGSSITVNGTLSKTGYTSKSLSVTINLGGSTVAIEWATLTLNDASNTITATIKADRLGTPVVGMDLFGLLYDKLGQIPDAVSTDGSTWRNPLDNVQREALKVDIAKLPNPDKTWGTLTLGDLVGKVMYFKKDATVYTVLFN